MKILMGALQSGGGIRTFFRYIYGQPDFNGCQFTLVAPGNGLGKYLNEFLPYERITLVPTEDDALQYMRKIRTLAHNEPFDLIHSHGFTAGALTELALTGVRTPHLMTGHDMFTLPLFKGLRGRLKWLLLRSLLHRITAIHTVSEDAKRNMLEYFPSVPERNIHPILHGIDTDFFQCGEAFDLKADIGLTPDTPLIGFFGRFMGPKGFRILIESLDIIRRRSGERSVPHVATFGWGGYVREDYAYLRDLGLADYFHQLPQTDRMPSALKSVDLVVMPSRWEACGLLAMESLVAGTPIIGSDCIGLREVLEDSPAQKFSAGNADALASIITEELQNLPQRREEFKRYQPVAVARFRIQRPAKELSELYTILTNPR